MSRGGRGGKGRSGQGRSGQGRSGQDRSGQGRAGEHGQGAGPARRKDQRIVVGLHPVREVLRAGHAVVEVLVDAEREHSDVLDDIASVAAERGVSFVEVDRQRIDQVAEGLVHQGVVARAGPFPYADLEDCRALAAERGEPLFLIALDQVTDPHNLGAIARSAEGFGAHGVLIASRRAASVTPTVEKAAAGALAHIPLVRLPNLVNALRTLKEEGTWVVGLDSTESVSMASCDLLTDDLVLVVGSEGRGLAHLTRVTCDALVKLPMHGRVGSFNASVAAAVALYEVQRRRTA